MQTRGGRRQSPARPGQGPALAHIAGLLSRTVRHCRVNGASKNFRKDATVNTSQKIRGLYSSAFFAGDLILIFSEENNKQTHSAAEKARQGSSPVTPFS